ncbi:MAG: TetR/AcrR family transcriptional regulator [Desulfomonilaceae bacterium]
MPKIGMEQIRKDEVIAATKRCTVKTGFTRLTIKAIANEAGLSTGVIYHYFKNKEDLLLNVIKEAFAQSHEKVMREVDPLTSETDKLFKHLENIHATVIDNPEFYTVMLNFLGQAPNDPEIKRIVTKFFSNLTSYVHGYLKEGVSHGEFSANKIQNLHIITVALGLGLGILCTLAPEKFDHNALGESYKEFVRRHIE